jgi:NAD(P)-dependent dehydrogenase (short-subunit alcohol dehydrogenase family)
VNDDRRGALPLPLLAGRVAVVTGAAQGIGAAIAETLSEHGAFVVATDIQFAAVPQAHLIPRAATGVVVRFALDVTDDVQWRALAGVLAATVAHVDVLVNNAAIAEQESLEDLQRGTWDRVMEVGLTGTWLGMKHCAPLLRAAGSASVVNIGSIYGGFSAPWGRSPAYHAMKGGVLALTRNAAAFWAEAGIRVNTVSPGIVRSGDQADSPQARWIIETTPQQRAAEPVEVARAVLYVASDWASNMTGADLRVDGGWAAV